MHFFFPMKYLVLLEKNNRMNYFKTEVKNVEFRIFKPKIFSSFCIAHTCSCYNHYFIYLVPI